MGLILLILLLVVLILSVLWYLYRQRQKKKDERGLFAHQFTPLMTALISVDESHSLAEPLIGENPTYMVHAVGTHANQNGSREYHQFSNPLYSLHGDTETSALSPIYSLAGPPTSSSSHRYDYPDRRSYLVESVYLPGDDSPLTGSFSSHPASPPTNRGLCQNQQCVPLASNTHSNPPPPRHIQVERGSGEVTQSPCRNESCLSTSGDDRGRMMSISTQHFQLPSNTDH